MRSDDWKRIQTLVKKEYPEIQDLEQGMYEHMMQRIEDTLNWCHIDPFGNAVMDYETLYSNIDYCTLWRIYCCALDFGKRKNITRMEKSREV